MDEQCVLKQVWVCLVVVVLVLVLVGLLPEWKVGEVRVNRVKVFSDLQRVAEEEVAPEVVAMLKDSVRVDSVVGEVDSVVRIEDFTADSRGLACLGRSLREGVQLKRPVRIAFLGDSYIEADIITADVREYFQKRYGGRGVGFVPVASPAEGYRQTVEHRSEGWTGYSMVYFNKADWKKLLVSGEYFIPDEGAVMSVKGREVKGSARFGEARFFFMNSGKTQIHAHVDGRDTLFCPPPDDSLLQQVCLRGNLGALSMKFTQVPGFTGFGTWLNDCKGVYVDNFAVRGSSGIVLSIMNKGLMEQLAEFVSYDLVVLEFGLNVVMPEAKEYSAYKKQMLRTIAHLRECFPGADFLLMSVGDRGYRKDGKVGTSPGVAALVAEQRDLARQAGILFWNTYEAMGGHNSMVEFVGHVPPLANKDYTHINHLGGRRIAEEMVRALECALTE